MFPLIAAGIPVRKYLFAIVACKYKVHIGSLAGFFGRPLLNLELISKIGICHHAIIEHLIRFQPLFK